MSVKDENVVFVGKKPTTAYVFAVVTQFSDGQNEVHIKARGKSINKAVDIAEIVRNRFVQNVDVSIGISTEKLMGERDEINVSSIDISLRKK